ncbi:MAG: ABC transporter ATP-binding protein [Planctomycetota bacterium]
MSLLEIRGLVKSHESPEGGRHEVLRVDEFALEEGEHVALLGRSGSGKTTLLNVVAGLTLPDEGRVAVAGTDVAELGEAARDRFRARHVGYVFQIFNLLQGYTALENVELGMAFGPGIDRGWAKELLVKLGLRDRLHHRPSQLSVGQQQRVAVARALANRPKLVLADEPTGNLDPEHAGGALELMLELCSTVGATLLLVSHDPAVLAKFERRVDLADVNHARARTVGA